MEYKVLQLKANPTMNKYIF